MSFCIFCGAPPSAKTREHVIPQWLLKLTGDPKRNANLGRDWMSPDFKQRIYAWSAFTFPACDACNGKWSALEARVKIIVEGMLASEPLSAQDFYVFLDWIDKVRTGLWLGMIYLNKNYRGVIPQFHIDDRVAQKDRGLLIFETDDSLEGIALGGIDSPIFHSSPSVFFLGINRFYFMSLSSDFLLARRMGWPFVSSRRFVDIDTDGFSAEMDAGTQRIETPVLPSLPSSVGTVLLQPIAHQYLRRSNPDEFRKVFLNDYVKASSIDDESGIGRLLIGNDAPTLYPTEKSDLWIPKMKYERYALASDIGLWSAELQRDLYRNQPDYSHFSDADREYRSREIEGILKIHDLIINHLRNGGL
ncbi:hypothetical protein [Acidicapsa ligni]|uniref:hypothetical protein n=1 Tax=Acidicapsa ligni TaxID=542300 RepID=UPI0021E09F7B|nr:hypothetical protein [Acidicapsa ligni]